MTQKKHTALAWKDPIVEEVRAAREKLFAACGHDLVGFVARLRERR